MKKELSLRDIDRIIEMGWEDRTTFDAISMQFGLKEQEAVSYTHLTLPTILLV